MSFVRLRMLLLQTFYSPRYETFRVVLYLIGTCTLILSLWKEKSLQYGNIYELSCWPNYFVLSCSRTLLHRTSRSAVVNLHYTWSGSWIISAVINTLPLNHTWIYITTHICSKRVCCQQFIGPLGLFDFLTQLCVCVCIRVYVQIWLGRLECEPLGLQMPQNWDFP